MEQDTAVRLNSTMYLVIVDSRSSEDISTIRLFRDWKTQFSTQRQRAGDKVKESRNVTFVETAPHDITVDFYLQGIYEYTSSLNSPTTTIDTTDNHSERNHLLLRLNELSDNGGIGTASNIMPLTRSLNNYF